MQDSSIYIASILNFLAVVGILVYFGRKPFLDFLAGRTLSIQQEMKEAETLSKDYLSKLSHWEGSWKAREGYINQQMNEAKIALQNLKEKELTKAKHEAERIQKDSEMMGDSEMVKAKKKLQEELVQKSIRLAENYLSKNLSGKDREKLFGEYIDLVKHG